MQLYKFQIDYIICRFVFVELNSRTINTKFKIKTKNNIYLEIRNAHKKSIICFILCY
jgi:hypothetical protein